MMLQPTEPPARAGIIVSLYEVELIDIPLMSIHSYFYFTLSLEMLVPLTRVFCQSFEGLLHSLSSIVLLSYI